MSFLSSWQTLWERLVIVFVHYTDNEEADVKALDSMDGLFAGECDFTESPAEAYEIAEPISATFLSFIDLSKASSE